MNPHETAGVSTVADAAGLAATYADRLLVGTTREVHRAIAGRFLAATGQRRTPVGVLHDRITGTVYGGIGMVTRAVAPALNRVSRLDLDGHETLKRRTSFLSGDVERSARGRRLRSIVNGLIGDVLRDQDSPVAIRATLRDPRQRGVDLVADPAVLSEAWPAATGRLAVFLHGLCEDDDAWSYQIESRGPSYLEQIAVAGAWTPLAVRYNSGLPIRDSAAEITALLDRIFDAWPTRVDEIALVGHSMGGLIVRSAAATAAPTWWADRVSHVVLLGAPNSGAPLERLVHRAIPVLRRLPEVAPFADILDERSVGIRDLHDGIGVDPTRWSQAAYHGVGATLGVGERAWPGRVFGDLLVLLDSARGSIDEVDADFRHIAGAHHFDLLNHPDIAADLRRWLGPRASSDRPSAGGKMIGVSGRPSG